MRTAEVKRRFLAHFEERGHTVVASAPLPADDPTLLFVNAGMVPFKPYMLGQVSAPYKRATSVQKCIRTLDIDEVGKTTRHGTFFQMNGNFSFGDYFKEDAIRFAWDLLTRSQDAGGYGLDPQRLWATVYLDDDEAYGLWRDVIGVPEERIVRRGMADNYWSMGVPGPCGPCSEIFYDRGPAYGREGGPEVDEDRYMEVWNLVFMQYERGEGTGKADFPILGELPAKNIDTGMGLERMAAILQGVDNLYEIDETRPILNAAARLTGKIYGEHSGQSAAESHPDDVRLRVVADHVRTALMLISDGVTPANEGRGYVLRRILRRSVRAMRLLGYDAPVLPELLPVARDAMAPSYPEVARDFERISSYAYGEEEAFRTTLRQGSQILDQALDTTLRAGEGGSLAASTAFQLHDTYGFPIDLTVEIAGERGLDVDVDGFRELMSEQKRRAKADSQAKKTGHADTGLFRSVLDANGPTDWLAYETLETDSTVLAIFRDGGPVNAARDGEIVQVVLDRTPFYAESGGQDSDAGEITAPSVTAEVLDVQRPVKGLVVHQVRVTGGELGVGQPVHARVDHEWRTGARQAHSGTHVVHAALREVLGPAALQSGSYNRPGYLRLDFAWRGALSPETRSEVEEAANVAVRRDLPVDVRYMPLPEARDIGALALFGETYDENVRVVEIGGAWSRELCGGTHVAHSSQIGSVAITGESSVGAGHRRVEAVTGLEGFRYLARERDLVSQIAEQLNAPRDELPARITALVERAKKAEREAQRLRDEITAGQAGKLAEDARDIDGIAYIATTTDGDARGLASRIRDGVPGGRPAVIAVVGTSGFVVTTNPAARERGLSAADLVRSALEGKGGGSPEMAQGKAPADAAAALDRVAALIPSRLG
ncbi:alanine--tRNA ligase [Actinomadura parmotrematis]|uniref:Alanine--tRNA ligase n=1 Tax=Actinomadura parmotrematis TaxID=2864039 RepID=A0ABS7FP30_9ACTN|nr:alanine--tRNA ligase [Actinomadura parmotrematis]MBW8482159.1 alanine--tRNA ligase [Actinomadura parmotrematis]